MEPRALAGKGEPPNIRSFNLELSPTENRLLSALMSAGGSFVPADHLANEVWGEPTKLDSLRFYVGRLRSKLTGHSSLRILNQKGLGYRIDYQVSQGARV
jgi:DNA-binding response OmpR family regulator